MAGAMWMQGILAFAASEANLDQAAMDASVACHLLPIPVTEVNTRASFHRDLARDSRRGGRLPPWPLTPCTAGWTRG